MGREKMVRLSENEHERLSNYRQQQYGTAEIPFGVVIDNLIDESGCDA